MKKFLKPKYLPYVTLGLGCLAFLSSFWLLTTGVDDRDLLNPAHPGGVALWVLTALMLAGAVVLSLPLEGKMRYDRAFPRSISAAVGTAVCAVTTTFTAFGELTAKVDAITTASGVVGLLAAVALGYLAWCRFSQIRPHFAALCVALVYLMMHMLCRYRVWSAEPELIRYFFPMAASVLLTLAIFHRLAFAVGMGDRRMYMLFTMLGTFCAMAALPGDGDKLFLAGMAAWAMTDLCSLRLRKARKKPEAA